MKLRPDLLRFGVGALKKTGLIGEELDRKERLGKRLVVRKKIVLGVKAISNSH